MDIEQPNLHQENETLVNEFLTRQNIKDPTTFAFDLDAFRMQHPAATQDIIRNPTKYYRIIRNFLEKHLHGEERRKW